MPPTKKVPLDKAAWAWCDSADIDTTQINEDHIKSSYRLNVQKCKIGSCRRNCRGNPFCLFGLGESRWLTQPAHDSEEDETDLEIRKSNTFVGLKNLGATCYVNSLLQLWFHNLAFRRAIFSWNPLEDPAEITGTQNDNSSYNSPTTVVGHLQLLFALMQFSKQKSIDPSAFIKALQLEPSTQQDAQEFSQLFISHLEESLKQQSDPSVQNLINNNFRGEYSYITRCSKCLKKSVSPSLFCELELNVKGHKTLHESIKEFLKEEKLEGVNMYSCSECIEKQEATRFISLHKLPPVLNLQLMRFIYDRQKGHKKKLNTCLQFPDTLDMSVYLDTPENERVPLMYNLTAVLIHKGPSAYSGHYIAHICDQTTGTWYKFNDENVEKMEGKKLILGSGDENEDGIVKKVKQPRLAKGFLASSNAYMLVYTAASEQNNKYSFQESDLQPHLREQVKKCNDAFDALINETKEQKKAKRVNGKAHRVEIELILQSMPVNNSEEEGWEVIATSWLIHWLSNAMSFVGSIDNSKLLCPHGKLNPDGVPNAKYISNKAASVLYEKHGGGPRLKINNVLCKDCVVKKCKSVRLRLKIAEDHKDITNLLKQKEDPDGHCFWVGKRSLKAWRRQATIKHLDCEERLGTDDVGIDRSSVPECDENELNSHVYDDESSPSKILCTRIEDHINHSDGQENSILHNLPDSTGENSVCLSNMKSLSQPLTIADILNNVENIINDTKKRWSYILNINKLNNDVVRELKRARDLIDSVCADPNLVSDSNCQFNIDNSEFVSGSGTVNNAKTDSASNSSNSSINKVLKRKREEEDDDEEEFNEDVKCVHGNLTFEEYSRRLVSEHIWSKLKWYFPECAEYPKESPPCETCQRVAAHGQEAMDSYKQQAQSHKDLLSSLLSGKNRPKLVSGTFHVVSVDEFLKPWRKFVREAGRVEPLHSLRNSSLICIHGDLMYSLQLQEESATVAAVTDDEWYILSSLFAVDETVTVTYGPNGEVIDTNPKLCTECMQQRLENEQKALLQYDKAKLYIRQISNKSNPDEVFQKNRSPSPQREAKVKPSSTNSLGELVTVPVVDTTSSQNTSSAAVATAAASTTASSTASTGVNGGANSAAQQCEVIRRSTRHRRVRGEKEIIVSSNETLRDLKVKILNILHVAPYDQHISTEDGRMLIDPSATLSSLNIFPNSVLLVRVDEPTEDSSTADDYIRTTAPEEGFKGTVLSSR